jgi:ABC-type sugar transport system ATPase subunit
LRQVNLASDWFKGASSTNVASNAMRAVLRACPKQGKTRPHSSTATATREFGKDRLSLLVVGLSECLEVGEADAPVRADHAEGELLLLEERDEDPWNLTRHVRRQEGHGEDSLLDHLAQLKGLAKRATRHEALKALLAKTSLWERRHQRLSGFSGGMKQPFGIAQALLGDPKLIIVDEPTARLHEPRMGRARSLARASRPRAATKHRVGGGVRRGLP